MPLKISSNERRARIGRRHRLAPSAAAEDAVGAADAVVGLHGTDAASVFLGAWARMRDGDVAAVERALYEERSLVRVLAMRRTMFVMPVGLASLALAASSRDVAKRERAKALAFVTAAGHGGDQADVWLSAAEDAALAALAQHGEATAPELAGEDPYLSATITVGAGSRYEATQKVVSRVLTVLGAEGRAVRTRPRGGWTSTQFRWAALERWQPAVDLGLDTDEARTALARAWLERFGPATLEDLRWWTGGTMGATRRAVGELDTVAVDLDGADGVALAGDEGPEPPPEPWVALLPALDATTMGWKERDWYLGDHGPRLFDRNGNAGPTIWADGRVVGAWAQAEDGEIRIGLLDDVGAETRTAVDARAADLAGRIGDARLSPRARARSPLERELLE